MSGRQAKKSRRLQQNVDKMLDKARVELEARKQHDVAETIALYNSMVSKQPFFKRLRHCWRIMNRGESMFNRRTTFYWVVLSGAVAAFCFVMVVRYAGILS